MLKILRFSQGGGSRSDVGDCDPAKANVMPLCLCLHLTWGADVCQIQWTATTTYSVQDVLRSISRLEIGSLRRSIEAWVVTHVFPAFSQGLANWIPLGVTGAGGNPLNPRNP